jgi:UDP-N-acetyl-D-glucosamine dehydrogenase
VAPTRGHLTTARPTPHNGSKILALGVAYKRDVDDVRESPAIDVMTLLLAKGAEVSFADPFVSKISLGDRKLQAIEATPSVVAAADVVLMLTDHTAFDRQAIAKHASLIVDTRNAFKGIVSDCIVRI